MPASIDKGIRFEASDAPGTTLYLTATDLGESFELSLPVTGRTDKLWVDYIAGIVDQFQQLGHSIPGMRIRFGGDIPRGSGMSSSAALEGGMAFLINEKIGAGLTRPELAVLCKRSSNNFLKIPSGIMDQFASLNGSANGPIILNCDTLEFQRVRADLPGYTWILVNSMVTHELSTGGYHDRVRECAQALAILQKTYPELQSLSETTVLQMESVIGEMPELIARRLRYVVGENERVPQMATALTQGDVKTAGKLLNANHEGIRDDFEITCAETDFLQAAAVNHFTEAVAGSRQMGGGFGGCTINLVKEDAVEAFKKHLEQAYQKEYNLTPEFYPVNIGEGTHLI